MGVRSPLHFKTHTPPSLAYSREAAEEALPAVHRPKLTIPLIQGTEKTAQLLLTNTSL
ncbi:MAG: hypothetical protein QXT66_04445 [Nitrososphaerota archaeon]